MKGEIKIEAGLIDVRKPSEWAISHVKDATFVPLAGMPDNLRSLDKTKSYFVHCGGGYRSMTAISLMKRHGFTKLTNVAGGFGAMLQAGVEVVTEDESIVSH
jgi:rhodanese-related sulfurtransferase